MQLRPTSTCAPSLAKSATKSLNKHMDAGNSEALGITTQCITVCSLDDIYLYPSNTQNLLIPQDTPKVLSDHGMKLRGQNFMPYIRSVFSSSCLQPLEGKKDKSFLYMPSSRTE